MDVEELITFIRERKGFRSFMSLKDTLLLWFDQHNPVTIRRLSYSEVRRFVFMLSIVVFQFPFYKRWFMSSKTKENIFRKVLEEKKVFFDQQQRLDNFLKGEMPYFTKTYKDLFKPSRTASHTFVSHNYHSVKIQFFESWGERELSVHYSINYVVDWNDPVGFVELVDKVINEKPHELLLERHFSTAARNLQMAS